MPVPLRQLVEKIHASPGKVVLAISGGGSRAISELLEVPGATATLLEAAVPYSEPALIAWLGGRVDQFCSARAARAMAMAAFGRACRYDRQQPVGVACTAALATDRPKAGPHRAHCALQTASTTAAWSLELAKGRRSRAEEEQLVSRLLLNVVAEACGVEDRLTLDLLEGEQVEHSLTTAPRPWRDLLLGRVASVCHGGSGRPTAAILPGAFNPLHDGHRRMAEIARQILHTPVAMEISIINADKPALDYFEIERRTGQFPAEQPIWLTRAPTFEEKSRLFPGATFIVGSDTLRRIAEPRFYGDDPAACAAALERIAGRRCRFLVFGRDMGTGFVHLGDLDVPDPLRAVCREVPQEQFRQDISSTALRRRGEW